MPHGSVRNTPTPSALTSGCSARTFVSQPVLCYQQWRKGVGLIQFFGASCYSTLQRRANVCVAAVEENEAGWSAAGQDGIQNTKCGNTARLKEWEGRSLAQLFYYRPIIHCLVNTEKKLSTSTLTALRSHDQSSGVQPSTVFQQMPRVSAKLVILHHGAATTQIP